ncbi:hypothetical protein BCR36DRAFT_579664 [Piromyces finnis]|uniref:SEC7 domain-containing protein n=1 Tax=Piromyces finnis TaxID=1754191 RepID=A0A1Y1VPB6_9FUNG|nr:hypothetical protein BCR36DRAFT_579664 [Piromyces finnis]|eukprot:ORX60210.1 hypothetical protein BCR36DRAFT_579664 [Piromyces finnis]
MDDKRQDYHSKKNHNYSPYQQKSYEESSHNEKSSSKTFQYERDSLPINEQKIAKLNKMFNDAIADFTTPSDLEDYNMTGSSSQTRNYRDKKLSSDYTTNPYRKHYQPVDVSYNKYLYNSSHERRPSQPEFSEFSHNTIERSSSEQLSPKLYALQQQRRYERMKQQNDFLSRSKYSSGHKYSHSQTSDNDKYYQDTINDNDKVYEEIRKNSKSSLYSSSLDNEQLSQSSSHDYNTIENRERRTSTRSLNSDVLRYGNDYHSSYSKSSLTRPTKIRSRKVSNASEKDYSENSISKSLSFKNVPQPLTELEKHSIQRQSSSKLHLYENSSLVPPAKSNYRESSPIRSQSNSPTINRKERKNEPSPKISSYTPATKDGTLSYGRSDIPDRSILRQQQQQQQQQRIARSLSPSTKRTNYNPTHNYSPSLQPSHTAESSNNNSNSNLNHSNNNGSGSLLFGDAEIKKTSNFTLTGLNNKISHSPSNHHSYHRKYSSPKEAYSKINTTPHIPEKSIKHSPFASASSLKQVPLRKNSLDENKHRDRIGKSSQSSNFGRNALTDDNLDIKTTDLISDLLSVLDVNRGRTKERDKHNEKTHNNDHEKKPRKEHMSSADRIAQLFSNVPESYKQVSADTESNNLNETEVALPSTNQIQFPMPPIKKSNKIEYEPRKFLYKGRVWQVINSSQAKDRCLFLFNDILIITKPIKNPGDNTFKYQTKSVLECKRLKSTLREERMSLYEYSRYFSHPAIIQAIHRFATNHIKALREIIEQNLLPCTPDSISYFLHCAPNLSKRQIGCFLGLLEHTDILESYLTDFPFRLLSIDESFRLLLQSITLPQDALALDHLLEVFSKKWYEENRKHININLATTLRIVYSILELNASIHDQPIHSENTSPVKDTHIITLNKFISNFTNVDGTCSAPPEFLTHIYKNIEKEQLETSTDIREERKTFTLSYYNHRNPSVKHMSYGSKNAQQLTTLFPSRLSQRETSDYITITIPEPDPNIQIQIFGQDLRIEPSVLHFRNSNKAQFRVRASKSQGRKLVMFYKLGSNATKYYSLEPKCIVIEPAFLRYSFGMEYFEPFPDNSSVSSRSSQRRSRRKRYLFAVKEKNSKEEWLKNLEPVTIPKEKFSMSNYPKKKRRRRRSSVCSSIVEPSILEETNESFSDLGSISGELYNSDDECELVVDMANDATSFILKEKVLPTDGPFLSEEELINLVKNNGKLSLIVGWIGELISGHRTLSIKKDDE